MPLNKKRAGLKCIKSNFQSLIGVDIGKAKEKIKEYLSKGFKVKKFKNPYGERGVSGKVVEEIGRAHV